MAGFTSARWRPVRCRVSTPGSAATGASGKATWMRWRASWRPGEGSVAPRPGASVAADTTGRAAGTPTATLVVRRTIRATADRLFEAWTRPAQLKQWWGPEEVECVDAEIDLRLGGRYRIANRLPNGKILWIAGVFEVIEPPHRLVYTWALEPIADPSERV